MRTTQGPAHPQKVWALFSQLWKPLEVLTRWLTLHDSGFTCDHSACRVDGTVGGRKTEGQDGVPDENCSGSGV